MISMDSGRSPSNPSVEGVVESGQSLLAIGAHNPNDAGAIQTPLSQSGQHCITAPPDTVSSIAPQELDGLKFDRRQCTTQIEWSLWKTRRYILESPCRDDIYYFECFPHPHLAIRVVLRRAPADTTVGASVDC